MSANSERSEDKKPKILHIDDEKRFLEVFSLTFGKYFTILSLDDPTKALDIINNQDIDLIITDYDMPVMDGLELLREIRQKHPDLPVIFYTGQGNENVAREAFLAGVSDYFTKEIFGFAHKERLINSINRCIEKQRTEKSIREAQAAVRENEERLRTLINAMPDIVCFKDGEGRWLEANDFTLKLFQLEGINYRGKKDSELAEFSPLCKNAFLTCEETDERTWNSGAIKSEEEVIPAPDGTLHVFEVMKIPKYEPDGRRKGLIVIGRDITERKRAEQILRESENTYRTIFENTGTAVVIIEHDTIISLANTKFSEVTGYTKEEIEGKKSWTEFVMKEDLERMMAQHFQRRIDPESVPKQYEFRLVNREGQIRNILLSVDVIPGTTKSVASLMDITDLKLAESKLSDLQATNETVKRS